MTAGPWPKGRCREPEQPSVESVEVSGENGKWVDGHTILRLYASKVRPGPKMAGEISMAFAEFRQVETMDSHGSTAEDNTVRPC